MTGTPEWAPEGERVAPQRTAVDTDVVLDVLLGRPAFVADAGRVFAATAEQRVVRVLAGRAVTAATSTGKAAHARRPTGGPARCSRSSRRRRSGGPSSRAPGVADHGL